MMSIKWLVNAIRGKAAKRPTQARNNRCVRLQLERLEERCLLSGGISEFAVPTANALPFWITSGPDGNLWFTEDATNKIGRITPSGAVTEFPITGGAGEIAPGPDGNLWFAGGGYDTIGKITPTGKVTEFTLAFKPPAGSQPYGITAGPDGNLWFTEIAANKIGRITPSGVVTEFAIPTANSAPAEIALGPDGNLWFTEVNKIGRITPSGGVTEFAVPTSNAGPFGIASGPDGNLWFTEDATNKIGRITPSGVVTEFAIPADGSDPEDITAGLDGNLWFTEGKGDKIDRITTSGVVTEIAVPTAGSVPEGIALGPDGNLWFAEQFGDKIGRVNLAAIVNPTTLAWDATKGGVDFGYSVSTNSVPTATQVSLYWSNSNQFSGAIGGPIYTQPIPAGTAVGSYGPFNVSAVTLGTPPPGAKYLLAVTDPGNVLGNFDSSKNVIALSYSPAISIQQAILQDATTVSFNYSLTESVPSFQIGLYRSANATFSSGDVLVGSLQTVTPSGGSGSGSITITAPLLDPSGTQPYLLVVADPLGVLPEANRANNVIEVTVQGAGPDALLEDLSRAYSYEDHLAGDHVGFGYAVNQVFSDPSTGFYALGLTSQTSEPILLFRGTVPSVASPDFFSDFDPRGVGYDQFLANKAAVEAWLAALSSTNGAPSLTGHSLGGALAQWFAADYTAGGGTLDEVVTFNATGISQQYASAFRPDRAGRVWHYVVNGDVVSLAGQAFLAGGYTLASFEDLNLLDKHLLPLLSATDDGTRIRPSGLTLEPFSSDVWLNSPFFLYTDLDYYIWLGAAEGVVQTVPALRPYAAAPLTMIFRSTVEQNRQAIGQAWRNINASLNLVFSPASISVTLPDTQVTLAGVAVQTTGAAITYSTADQALTIQGTVTLPTLYSATADFSAPNYIKITDSGLQVAGTLSVQNVVIVPNEWVIRSASLSFDTVHQTVGASADLLIPGGADVHGQLGFVSGQFNSVSLAWTAQGPGQPIGATGAFLQSVTGEIDHIAVGDPQPTLLTGSVVITGGPQVSLSLPSWAGGNLSGSLLQVQATATVTASQFAVTGTVTLMAGLATGQGSLVFDWQDGVINATADLHALGNVLDLQAGFSLDSSLDFTAFGSAAVQLPNYGLLLHGQQLASGYGYMQYRSGGALTDDYVLASGVLHMGLFGDVAMGVKVDFAGNVTVIDGLTQLPHGSTAVVPTGVKRLILTLQWANAISPYQVEVIGPDGHVYSQADIANSSSLLLLVPLSGQQYQSVGVLDPAPGDWTIELVSSQDPGTEQDAGFVDEEAPAVAFTGVVANGTQISLSYTTATADGQAQVGLYYDTSGAGYKGVRIADDIPSAGGAGNYVWDSSSAFVGPYSLYAVLSDGNNPLAIAYSAQPAFGSTPVTTARSGQAYTYAVTASEPYVSHLAFTLVTAPAWLTLADRGDGTATLSGVPGAGDVGTATVALQVSDGVGPPVVQTFSLQVMVGATDVTSQVQVSRSGLTANRRAHTFAGAIGITNIGGAAINGGLVFVWTNLAAGVSMQSVSVTINGVTTQLAVTSDGSGNSEVVISSQLLAQLAVGQTITLNVVYYDPTFAAVTFLPDLISDPSR